MAHAGTELGLELEKSAKNGEKSSTLPTSLQESCGSESLVAMGRPKKPKQSPKPKPEPKGKGGKDKKKPPVDSAKMEQFMATLQAPVQAPGAVAWEQMPQRKRELEAEVAASGDDGPASKAARATPSRIEEEKAAEGGTMDLDTAGKNEADEAAIEDSLMSMCFLDRVIRNETQTHQQEAATSVQEQACPVEPLKEGEASIRQLEADAEVEGRVMVMAEQQTQIEEDELLGKVEQTQIVANETDQMEPTASTVQETAAGQIRGDTALDTPETQPGFLKTVDVDNDIANLETLCLEETNLHLRGFKNETRAPTIGPSDHNRN